MKHLSTYLLAMALASPAFANITPMSLNKDASHSGDFGTVFNFDKKRMPMPQRENSDAAEVEVSVKINFGTDYIPSMGYPLRAYNSKTSRSYSLDQQTTGEIEGVISLPAGTYDFMLITNHLDYGHYDNSDHESIVILENIEVGENSIVELDPHTATNHISFKSYTHDGELSVQPTERYIDDSNKEIIEEGNVNTIGIIKAITHTDFNMIEYAAMGSTKITLPSEAHSIRNDGAVIHDFYVNNVSDKYEFRQIRHLIRNDGTTDVVILSQNGCNGNVEVCNDYNDYFKAKIDIADTPISENYTHADGIKPYMLAIGATMAGGEIPGMMQAAQSADPSLFSMWVSPGKSTSHNPMAVAYWCSETYEKDYTVYNLVSPYLYLTADVKSSYAMFPKGNYEIGEKGQFYGKYYAGHPGLSIDFDDNNIALSESTPFCLMSFSESLDWFNNRIAISFDAESYGQSGELRGADKVNSIFTIHYNGEEVLQGMDFKYEWPSDWAEVEHEPGEYKFTVVNENIKIDGIEGKNIAELHLDQKNEDYYPPVMQMIQTRDKNGHMQIRFDKASEGELRIVGGDFNPVKFYPEEGSDVFMLWYSMGKADLTVEYAPNGTEDFHQILNRDAYDGYGYWGFNKMHIVPLDEIDIESDNKWYDLRITFTDEAGNYQKQILSPAFRIENPAVSVDRVTTPDAIRFINGTIYADCPENALIEVYDASGRIVGSTNGSSMTLDASAHGIFIVRVTSDNGIRTAKISQ